MEILAVFFGSGLGAILRYYATVLSNKYFTTPHYGTFCVNIIGCLLIGYIIGFFLHKEASIPNTLKIFLTMGLLGGLTTFSTFSWEAFDFIKEGKFLHALLYILTSILIGLISTYIGFVISKLS